MKKFLWLIVTCVSLCWLYACEESENSEDQIPAERTYTITTYLGMKHHDERYGTKTTLQLKLLEYNNKNELINSQIWADVSDDDPRTFNAHRLATKLVIFIELDSTYGDMFAEINQYVAQVFNLSSTNTDIIINGNTLISEMQPIK
mgnify:CR=1 FL=1